MAVTFRAEKGSALTYSEMDQNFGSYFYSASTDGQSLTLHYPPSLEVPINSGSYTFSLVTGLQNAGEDRAVTVFSGSSAITSSNVLIDESGSLGVGVSYDQLPLDYKLVVSGSIKATGTVLQSSDVNLKKDITNVDNALDIVNNLQGVYYNWKDEQQDKEDGRNIGVIAQEVEKLLPEVVFKDRTNYLSVNYSGIVPVLIEAIKEQNQLISTLEKRIETLENR